MKRSLALLGLVLALVAGTAGMASALTLDFTSAPPYSEITLGLGQNNQQNMQWSGDGGGHLYCNNSVYDNIISFTTPTYVNNFQMNGLLFKIASQDEYTFGSMSIAAFNATNEQVWITTVDFTDYANWANWLKVDVNTAAVFKIIFYGPNPLNSEYGPNFCPSIDNLVITESAVPFASTVWLLASGLLALVGLRRKFTR